MREAAYLRDRRPPCLLCGLGLVRGFEFAVVRVSFSHEHVPPPLGLSTPEAQSMSESMARASGGICSKSSRIASSTALLMLIMSLQI